MIMWFIAFVMGAIAGLLVNYLLSGEPTYKRVIYSLVIALLIGATLSVW